MEQTIAVKTVGLTKEFSGCAALQRCDISVKQGEIYGILGPNGAGKTTLLKLIAGLLEPTEGGAEVFGFSSNTQRDQVLRQLGSLIETPCFYEHLSAAENLSIHLAYMGAECDIPKLLAQVGLNNVGEKATSQFSLGMRQRLGLARALAHKPRVLLLDEPINGLDPIAIREMRQLFRSLAEEQGMTLLLSSHILSEVEQTVDRVAILTQGRLMEEADMQTLKAAHPADLEDYLIEKMNGGALC